VGVHSLLRALPALDCWNKEYELYGLWYPFEGAFTYLVVSFSSFEEWVSWVIDWVWTIRAEQKGSDPTLHLLWVIGFKLVISSNHRRFPLCLPHYTSGRTKVLVCPNFDNCPACKSQCAASLQRGAGHADRQRRERGRYLRAMRSFPSILILGSLQEGGWERSCESCAIRPVLSEWVTRILKEHPLSTFGCLWRRPYPFKLNHNYHEVNGLLFILKRL